ncbi:MAG: pantetheine-phosphate adenylyltransferase [Prevotella sp.]|nr:pantetheine-phosphate adenylyltransferase [Prevotella sp.]
MKTAIFTGTFDPFTIGHASIVKRGLHLFDRIVVGVAVGKLKNATGNVDERTAAIARLYANEPRVEVLSYNDLTVDLAKRVGADCILRGVRSAKDFEYERDQAEINRQLGGMETLLFFAEPHLAAVSSSLVRELTYFGRDVSEFLP